MTSVDLTRAIGFRSQALNTVAGDPAVGCTVESIDISEVEVRQFLEPKPLADGFYMGPVYLGIRKVAMSGTVYDVSLGAATDRLEALATALYPTAEYIATPTSFGFAALTFYEIVTGTPQRTLYVRSNGLRVEWTRAIFADSIYAPHSIPWSATFIAIDPDVT